MTTAKPCFICAKEPRSEGKLCPGCWEALDYEVDRLSRLPQRLKKAVSVFWKEATRVD